MRVCRTVFKSRVSVFTKTDFCAVAQGVFLASSGLLSATAATMSGVGIFLGAAAAVLNYSVLQANTSNLENAQAERETRIDVMTEGATLLNTDLSKLFSKKRSIVSKYPIDLLYVALHSFSDSYCPSQADVMKTIKDALYHVNQLQSQIRVFMQFLKQISTLISRNVDISKYVYNTLEHMEDLVDPSIKEVKQLSSLSRYCLNHN